MVRVRVSVNIVPPAPVALTTKLYVPADPSTGVPDKTPADETVKLFGRVPLNSAYSVTCDAENVVGVIGTVSVPVELARTFPPTFQKGVGGKKGGKKGGKNGGKNGKKGGKKGGKNGGKKGGKKGGKHGGKNGKTGGVPDVVANRV